MQTESVSSRDLSSPEGLGGNQTEYLRQASLIPLVRPKSHVHTHTHAHYYTHIHACAHTLYRHKGEGKEEEEEGEK